MYFLGFCFDLHKILSLGSLGVFRVLLFGFPKGFSFGCSHTLVWVFFGFLQILYSYYYNYISIIRLLLGLFQCFSNEFLGIGFSLDVKPFSFSILSFGFSCVFLWVFLGCYFGFLLGFLKSFLLIFPRVFLGFFSLIPRFMGKGTYDDDDDCFFRFFLWTFLSFFFLWSSGIE